MAAALGNRQAVTRQQPAFRAGASIPFLYSEQAEGWMIQRRPEFRAGGRMGGPLAGAAPLPGHGGFFPLAGLAPGVHRLDQERDKRAAEDAEENS